MAQPLNPIRRRCAAFIALSEVFENEQIMQVMWTLEEQAQLADRMTFIIFFAEIIELLGVSRNTLFNLYTRLNSHLNLPDHQLPDDPMPEMIKFRKIEKSSTLTKKAVKKINESQEMLVFTDLISSIVDDVNYPQNESYTLFNEVFKEEIAHNRLDDSDREQIITWFDRLNLTTFKKNIASQQLSTMMNCLYVALCEALGSDKANEILTTLPSFNPEQMREHFKHKLQTDKEVIQKIEKPYQFTLASSHVLVENTASQDLIISNQSDFKAHDIKNDLVVDQVIDIPLEIPDPSVFKASQFEIDKEESIENLKTSSSSAFKANKFNQDPDINNIVNKYSKSVSIMNLTNLISIGWDKVNKTLHQKK